MNMQEKPQSRAAFQWDDPFLIEDQLGEEERMIRDAARAFADAELAPRVEEAYLDEKTDPQIFKLMGRAGLLGITIPERIWRGRRELRFLRTGGARGRAHRFGLPLDDERAVVAGDVSDLRLRVARHSATSICRARVGRSDRLLRPDRAGCRFRPRRHEDAGREDAPAAIASPAPRCGSPTRRSPTCSSCGRSRTRMTTPFAASCSTRA